MVSLLLAVAGAHAGTWVDSPYWVVTLQCHRDTDCFAASNGSYTSTLSGARRFDDPAKAAEFISTFTSSLREKSPEVQQRVEQICEAQPADGRDTAAVCDGRGE